MRLKDVPRQHQAGPASSIAVCTHGPLLLLLLLEGNGRQLERVDGAIGTMRLFRGTAMVAPRVMPPHQGLHSPLAQP